MQIMIRIIFIVIFVAVDLMIIFFAPSNSFSCVNFFLFDSDMFKRMQ